MFVRTTTPWWVLVAAAFAMTAGCALQGDLNTLNRRVYSLEKSRDEDRNRVAQLGSEVAGYEEARGTQATLRAQFEEMRNEIGQLRGELEKAQHEAGKSAATEQSRETDIKRLEKAIQSSLDRIVRVEEYLGLEPSEKLVSSTSSTPQPEQPAEGPPEAESVQETPEELYRKAKEFFDRSDYENARESFRTFVNRFPKSKLADNAQFWIGEIYYLEKWYEKAILEYQKVIENYPDGNKTASALLKQGFSFLNLKDKENARLILKELIRKFPDSSEAHVAKNKLTALE